MFGWLVWRDLILAWRRRADVLATLSAYDLGFIDSTGLNLLVRTVGDARIKHWRFIIEPELTPQVLGLFKLVQLEHFLLDADGVRA